MHQLFHLFTARWTDIWHLTVPGYQHLYQQRCGICGKTRVHDRVREAGTP